MKRILLGLACLAIAGAVAACFSASSSGPAAHVTEPADASFEDATPEAGTPRTNPDGAIEASVVDATVSDSSLPEASVVDATTDEGSVTDAEADVTDASDGGSPV